MCGCRSIKCPGRQQFRIQGAHTQGAYTAADSPDKRKNPDLYTGIQHVGPVTLDAGGPAATQPASSSRSTGAAPPAEPSGTSGGHAAQQPPSASSVDQREGSGANSRMKSSRPPVKPEVLAPAGGWTQLKAAVENGADAVYFGKSCSLLFENVTLGSQSTQVYFLAHALYNTCHPQPVMRRLAILKRLFLAPLCFRAS